MSWQILISISVLVYSVSVLLQKTILKSEKGDPISFSIFFQAGVALVAFIIISLVKGIPTIPDMSQVWTNVLLMAVLYGLANIAVFKSLKLTDASTFGVIFQSKNLFAIIGTSLMFKEILTSKQWIGATLLILGVVIVSLTKKKIKLNKGSLFALLAGFLFGAANINDRFLVNFFDPYTYVIIGFLFPAIFISILYPKKLIGVKTYFEKKTLIKSLVLFLIYGLSAVAFFAALATTTNAAQLFTINAFTVVVVVVFSIIFLKEKDYIWRKLVGSVVSLIGLLMVA